MRSTITEIKRFLTRRLILVGGGTNWFMLFVANQRFQQSDLPHQEIDVD